MRLLIIEGFQPLRQGLAQHFSGHGFVVDAVINDADGIWLASRNPYDIVLVDLPVSWEISKATVESIRASHDAVVIITMGHHPLTPDDACNLRKLVKHLLKPFSLADALQLVQASIGTGGGAVVNLVRLGGIEMTPSSCEIRWNGHIIGLEPIEFEILGYLGEHCGEYVSRKQVWERFFKDAEETPLELVDKYIRSLRRKLSPEIIRVRKRHGYCVWV